MVLGVMTSTGYLFVVLILMVGVAMGDTGPYTMLFFNLFGFLFYVAVGSAQIAFYRNEERPQTGKHTAFSMGAMSILTSFSFLVDTTWSTLDLWRK